MPDVNDNSSFDSVKSNEQPDLDNYYNIETNERNDIKKLEDAPRASEALFMTTRSGGGTRMPKENNGHHTRFESTGIQTNLMFKTYHHSSQT